MQNSHRLLVYTVFSALLVSQVSLVAYAHHNDDAGKKAREDSEAKSQTVDAEESAKYWEIREAFDTYREAFKAWKTASGNYKDAKSAGIQETIDSTKIILDQAFVDKNAAYDAYQELKK